MANKMGVVALMYCAIIMLAPAHGEDAPGENSLPPSVRLDLRAMPKIEDNRVRNAIISYDAAAKAWWIEMRCKIGAAEEHQEFQDGLAILTKIMNGVFQDAFHVAPEKAYQLSQTVQMYALEQMSSAQFFGCGDEARSTWLKGFTETKRVVTFATSKANSATP